MTSSELTGKLTVRKQAQAEQPMPLVAPMGQQGPRALQCVKQVVTAQTSHVGLLTLTVPHC